MGAHLDRARLLLGQARHELAERELRLELAEVPNCAECHALLALCLAKREAFDEAEQEARTAIESAPDHPLPFHVLASVLDDRHRPKEALSAIREAIRIDPENADYHSAAAAVFMQLRDWKAALAAADEGLAFDPEHVRCTNLRAMALVMLGETDLAEHSIRTALARDPDNAFTHANQGWALLEQREPRQAMEHFREALRLKPGLEWARVGIVEAMKARNFVYRQLLRFFLWMAKLPAQAQWGILIGAVVLMQVVQGIPDELSWLRWTIIGLYLVFVFLTWLGSSLFDLILRLDRFGKLALSREQIITSNGIAACIVAALAVVVLAIAQQVPIYLYCAGGLLFLALPISAIYRCEPGWPRNCVMAMATLLAINALGLLSMLIYEFAIPGTRLPAWAVELAAKMIDATLIGGVASTWLCNLLASVTVRR